MSDGIREKIKVHQKWGFGMAPPKERTVVLRQKAARLVLKALSGEKSTDSDSLAEAISEVKGLFNRSKKMDQWDWFVVCRVITKFLGETQGLPRERGIVKRVLTEKGYGFLSSDDKDFFFHAKEVKGTFSEFKEGDTVEFKRLHTSRGYAASDIRRVM